MTPIRIVPAGDAALLIELGSSLDPVTNARAVALSGRIRQRGLPVRDIVTGFASVTVYFDPLIADADALSAVLTELADRLEVPGEDEGRLFEVPVVYGGRHGPDVGEVAIATGLSESEVAELHASVTYRVYMLGFVPGFAYMASLDPRLAIQRRATPRARVPAGSVAIAAGQTGIYPMETPGGWHVIGRTTVRPFDPDRSDPFLFRAGDRVRFHPVPA